MFVILQPCFTYKALPDAMAVYFDFFGKPNFWLQKTRFFIIWYAIIGITNITTMFVPFIIKKFPGCIFFIPERLYWLKTSEDNKTECIQIISTTLKVTSLLINLILFLLYQCIIEYNIISAVYTPFTIIIALEVTAPVFAFSYPLIRLQNPKRAGYN